MPAQRCNGRTGELTRRAGRWGGAGGSTSLRSELACRRLAHSREGLSQRNWTVREAHRDAPGFPSSIASICCNPRRCQLRVRGVERLAVLIAFW